MILSVQSLQNSATLPVAREAWAEIGHTEMPKADFTDFAELVITSNYQTKPVRQYFEKPK